MFSKKMMLQGGIVTLCLILTMSFVLKGDLKYLESTQITGGMMEGMTKMLGLFGAKWADLLLQIFGISVFLLPIHIWALGWKWVRSSPIESPWFRNLEVHGP